MAGTNKFIKFATLTNDVSGYDTMTDAQLNALPANGYDYDGIGFGSIARTNILNGLFRQLTYSNKALNDVIAAKMTSSAELNTSMVEATYKDNIISAIENIAKSVSVTLAPSIAFTGTRSGITINTQGLVTNVVPLAYTDLPSMASGTFIGRTAAGAGTPSAITAATILSTIGAVPTSRTVAGLDLTTNRTRDDIIGVTTNGFVKRTGANTYAHDATTYVPTSRTIAGTALSSNITLDTILGITTNGFVKRTGVNTYAHDATTYAALANVSLKDVNSPTTPKFWVGTENQYTTATKDSSVVYIII